MSLRILRNLHFFCVTVQIQKVANWIVLYVLDIQTVILRRKLDSVKPEKNLEKKYKIKIVISSIDLDNTWSVGLGSNLSRNYKYDSTKLWFENTIM
jgi:hypothetical protein